MNIVECGVCDGLAIYYAINAYAKKNYDFKVYLYDSWQKMEKSFNRRRFNKIFNEALA